MLYQLYQGLQEVTIQKGCIYIGQIVRPSCVYEPAMWDSPSLLASFTNVQAS